MQQLVNELKQARGEIKRIRIDLNKFKSEEVPLEPSKPFIYIVFSPSVIELEK